jgi:deoxyribonuclease V
MVDRDLDALRDEQAAIAERVVLEDRFEAVDRVAGFDVAYGDEHCYGALAYLAPGDSEPVEVVVGEAAIELPYIPGLLAYRELPALGAAVEAAGDRWPPDVRLVDGGGLIHPRRLGSACHAGVRYDVPSVGETTSLLLGEVERAPAEAGEAEPVVETGETIGYAYRSSARANPIYVSPGHRVTAATALDLVERCCTGRKLPAPIQRAHEAAGEARDRARSG